MPRALLSRFLEDIKIQIPLTEGTVGYTLAVSGVSLGCIADCVLREDIEWRETFVG